MDTPLESLVRVGKVERAEKFEKCRKNKMAKLWINLGDKKVQSAAQLLYNHEIEKLKGKMVLCATELGEVKIAGFTSEVLTLGVPGDEGNPALVSPDEDVPLGGKLY